MKIEVNFIVPDPNIFQIGIRFYERGGSDSGSEPQPRSAIRIRNPFHNPERGCRIYPKEQCINLHGIMILQTV